MTAGAATFRSSQRSHTTTSVPGKTGASGSASSILGGFVRHAPVLSIDRYTQILFDCGAEDILVFEKVYAHVLADSDAVVEWISGTACVPYFERLGEHKDEFVQAIRSRMHEALPEAPVFYPFRRTFFSARKPA